MSPVTPAPNPAHREDAVARLVDELGRLGARLTQVHVELGAVTSAPSAGSAPAAASTPSAGWVRPPLPVPPPPSAPMFAPAGPGYGQPPPSCPPRPPVPPPLPPRSAPAPARPPVRTQPVESWWRREGAVTRVVALAGAAATIIGVVMLLVLAAQDGWLGPVPRAIGGAVLSVGLIGLGARVHRRERGHNGAVALAATGLAGLYLDTVAVTAYYGWLPLGWGVVLGAVLAAGGLALAHAWNTELLAVLAVGGAAVLAPVVVVPGSLALVGFLLALQIGGAVLTGRRHWRYLFVLRTVAPALAAALTVLFPPEQGPAAVAGVCILVTVVGLGLAVWELHHHPAAWEATSALAVAVGPTLLCTAVLTRWQGAGVGGGLTVVLLGVLLARSGLAPRARGSLLALAALALFQATALAASGGSLPALLLAESTVFALLAHRLRSRGVLIVASAYATLGALLLPGVVPLPALVSATDALGASSPESVLASVLLVVAALALVVEVRLSGVWRRPWPLWWITAAAALYGITATSVLGAVAVLGTDGFVVGHSVATVAWVTAGLVGVGVASRAGDLGTEVRVAGLVLAAAAVAKLLLFDLAALSGLARVAAFLVTGLLLLWRGALAQAGTTPGAPAPEAANAPVRPTGA